VRQEKSHVFIQRLLANVLGSKPRSLRNQIFQVQRIPFLVNGSTNFDQIDCMFSTNYQLIRFSRWMV